MDHRRAGPGVEGGTAAFACPACRGDLAFALRSARCEGCGAAYPKVTSETYLLAGRFKGAMLREGLRWSAQQVDIHRDRLNVLDGEQWRPASWDATRLKLQLALTHNLSIYHSINAKLVELK